MPDQILLIVFGTLSTLALIVGVAALYFAFRAAKKAEGELQMVMWGVLALGALTFAGMAWAYFIIPILVNRYL